MNQARAVVSLVLFAVFWGCSSRVEATNMGPQLVPLPRSQTVDSREALTKENIQLLQGNVNLVSNGEQEPDLSQPPKLINMPATLELARANNSDEPLPTAKPRQDSAFESIHPRKDLKAERESSSTTAYPHSTTHKANVKPPSGEPKGTRAGNAGYRMEVGLLFATSLIVSTCMSIQQSIW
jgi:hypothetical protein